MIKNMQPQIKFKIKSKRLPIRFAIIRLFVPLFFMSLASTFCYSQNHLAIFEHLTPKTWKAEGKWGDGSLFKQESEFSFALDSTLVLVKSKGFTNQEQTEYDDRNHGIRKWNSKKNILEFWEFDVFGGVTQGKIFVEDKNLRYEYDYGGTLVSDYWEFVDDNTYNFKVGNYVDGEWKQVYLKTQFRAQE